MSQSTVSRILSPAAALTGFSEANDHSSSSAITGGIKRPTRRLCGRAVRCGFHRGPPYLVLLRAGFCLPRVLPRARCALTAPFHPYPPSRSVRRVSRYGGQAPVATGLPTEMRALDPPSTKVGGIFSVPLSFRLPRPGVTRRTALRSSDFPLTFASDRLVDCDAPLYYPSVSCEIWYCSSFLYKLLRGVSITSAVFEIFHPFSRSLVTR